MFSFSSKSRRSSQRLIASKQQLINILNIILALDFNDQEFNNFLHELEVSIPKSNLNQLYSMIHQILGEKRIKSNYPLFIWLIHSNPIQNESILLKLFQDHHQVLSHFLSQTDFNLNDENLLMWSVKTNCITLTKYLLDSQQKNLDINAVNKKNQSIVTLALIHHHNQSNNQMISTLLQYSTLNFPASTGYQFGHTAVSWAVSDNFGEDLILKILSHSSVQEAGVDFLNQRDTGFYGRTALLWAARQGHLKVLKYLLSMKGIHWNVKDKQGTTPATWSAHFGKGSSFAVLLDSPMTDSTTLQNQVSSTFTHLSSDFFQDFFQSLNEINPSPEIFSWFSTHPQLNFTNPFILRSYLKFAPTPLNFQFISKFNCGAIPIYTYPSNPSSTLGEFQALAALEESKSKKRDTKQFLRAFIQAFSSGSLNSLEFLEWAVAQLDGQVKLKDSELGDIVHKLVHSSDIVDSFIHPCTPSVLTLKEVAAQKVIDSSISYDSTTLITDLIELFQDPRSWVIEKGMHFPTFVFDRWRRVSDEIENRLCVLIEVIGGVEAMKECVMKKIVLERIFDPYTVVACGLQLPLALSLLIHRYKIVSLDQIEDIIGQERISKYLNKCFSRSPYMSLIVDIFSPALWFIRWLKDERTEEDMKKSLLISLWKNRNLCDEQTVLVLDKLCKLRSQDLLPLNLTTNLTINEIIEAYPSTKSPYKPKFISIFIQ